MNLETEIQKLDKQIEEARKHVEAGAALDRLAKNKDFKLLISQGYLTNEAVRLVHAKSAPALQSEAAQAAITRDINGIGSLVQYFNTIEQRAAIARRDIEGAESEREEMLANEVGETE